MRIFTLFPAIIVFFLTFPVIVRCQITQNWARSFTAPNGYNPRITTDGSGNIYVAGSTASTAYTLIKYNSAGTGQWSTTGAAGSASHGVVGIGVDRSGNVYLVGNGSSGMNVVAYNPSGAELWSTVLNTGGLIAYSSTGAQLWIQNGSANNNAIAIDASGNIITGGVYYFNISKYTPTGSLTWSYSNSGIVLSGNAAGGYLSMALDKVGNCYVTSPASNFTEYFTAEVSNVGSLTWSMTYSSGSSSGSSGIAVYNPVARLGQAAYSQVNVTGVASGATNFTTLQYSYHPTLKLSSNSAELNGLDELTTTTPANRLSNYPNPFRGSTTISYTLANDSHVTLQVYDPTGKLVTALFEGDQDAGSYNLPFAADNLAAGIYYYRIVAASPNGNFMQTNSLSILR